MKYCIILGTRPEIIKMSPVIRECARQYIDYFILHTGQHYSYNMDQIFFEQLELPQPKVNLDVGSGSHGKQTAKILSGIEETLQKESPDIVIIQGDTNTVLAGALAAAKLGIKFAHIEAGLRSYDKTMPEEINRIVADHCADYLFAPTEKSKQILLHEGIPPNQVYVVGNTIVDAVKQNLKIAKTKTDIIARLNLQPNQYMLATSHRQENVDNKAKFRGIVKGLQQVKEKFHLPIIYPIHPRAKKQLKEFNINAEGLTLVEPLDYLAFLQLESKARLILTDSGGLQEEACILNIPCVTLRENTERPETIDVGSNILAGTNPARILKAAQTSLQSSRAWTNPFGDGTTSQKIINILRKQT